MKQAIKHRFSALAVVGSLVLGGMVVATPAQAVTHVNFSEQRWVGHFHWKSATAVENGRHVYNWSDLLDKDWRHWSEVGHLNRSGKWIGIANSGWTKAGTWSKAYRGIDPGTAYYYWARGREGGIIYSV